MDKIDKYKINKYKTSKNKYLLIVKISYQYCYIVSQLVLRI